MRHFQSITVSALTVVMMVLLFVMGSKVNEKPTRDAFVVSEVDGKRNAKKIKVRTFAILTDKKLINFAERVAVTCFSFTPLNYETKSNYCAEQYFSSYPAKQYKTVYAESIGRQISDDEATQYATVPRKPIIATTWDKTNFQYYVVLIPVISTKVLRDKRIPESKMITLWIAPKLKTVNPYQFEIVGIRI